MDILLQKHKELPRTPHFKHPKSYCKDRISLLFGLSFSAILSFRFEYYLQI